MWVAVCSNCFAEPFWGGEGFLHAHKFWNPTVLLPYLAKALDFLTALFSNASLLCIWLKPNHWGILAHMTKSSHNLAEAWNSWQTLPRESPRTELAEGINSPLTRSKSNAFWIENWSLAVKHSICSNTQPSNACHRSIEIWAFKKCIINYTIAYILKMKLFSLSHILKKPDCMLNLICVKGNLLGSCSRTNYFSLLCPIL